MTFAMRALAALGLLQAIAVDAHAQAGALLAIAKPASKPAAEAAPTPAPAPDVGAATPETSLALRLTTIEAALRADAEVGSSERAALESALARVAVTIRALASAAGKLDAERSRDQAEPPGAPIVVEDAYARWFAQLPADPGAAELWVMLARLGNEVRSLRRQERDLVVGALAGGLPENVVTRELWTPLPLEAIAGSMPDAPGHAPAVMELARAAEDRRAEITAAVDALRASPVERIERLRATRAVLASRIALVQRQIEHVSAALSQAMGAAIARIEAVSDAALAQFPPESEATAHARALRDLAQEAATIYQRDMLFEQRAILHADQLDEIARMADDTRERLSVQGASQAIGLVLVNDLAKTLPPERLGEDLESLRRSLADLQIRIVDLRAQVLASSDANAGVSTEELFARTANGGLDAALLSSLRLRLLVVVEAASQALAAAMRGEETTLTELERRNRELRALIAGRLLWTRSHAPIDMDWWRVFGKRLGGVASLGKPLREGLSGVARALGTATGLAVAALVVVGWLIVARWQRRRLGDLARAGGPPDLATAVAAVVRALLLAAPFAWIAVTALRGVRGNGPPGSFDDSVLSGVGWSAWTALLLVAIAVTARAQGVGELVLGWAEPTRRALRNASIGLLLLVLPSQIAVSGAWYRADLPALQYEARAVFIACWIGVAVVLWRALRAGGVWPEWRGLLRRVLRVALVVAASSAAIASALGYQISALATARQLEGTIGVLGTLILAHGLALVAIVQSARRTEDRLAVQERLAHMEGAADTIAQVTVTPAEVEAHGRRLAALALTVGGAAWLAMLWVGLLPALRQLEDVVLWHVAVGEARVPISLLDLIAAAGVVVVVVVALRLLPSLLDAVLRERTRVEPGTRYAIGALVRYAITIVGVIAAFGLIGVRWSHLQWMAAALTVGLGFGLQEIFANFVSGLIVLFERQVRVGDIVTVGEVTGRVTRISTRATTVLDFDRREIMIPNKALITDRLINWSLTSGLTRTTVRVGVAFGTDPALVHRLLREIAEATPKVLARPPPLTVFTGFGRSNLEFELRAFVASFDDRESVSNDIHARIAAAFPAAGISMDYEQVDVRIVANAGAADASSARSPRGAAVAPS